MKNIVFSTLLLCISCIMFAQSSRIAKIEGNTIVIYSQSAYFSNGIQKFFMKKEATIPRCYTASGQNVNEALDNVIQIVNSLQDVVSIIKSSPLSGTGILEIQAPGIGWCSLGYTEELGWGFYCNLTGAYAGLLMNKWYNGTNEQVFFINPRNVPQRNNSPFNY